MPGIGDSCISDLDCTGVDVSDSNGGPAICRKQQVQLRPGGQAVAGAAYTDGYCTRTCYDNTQCGTGNRCGIYGGVVGESVSICYKGCAANGDCRAGYNCVQLFSAAPVGICAPASLPDGGFQIYDAGPGPSLSTLGADCTQNSDCQNETQYGFCLQPTLPDGGLSGYGTGECVADCRMAPTAAWCMGLAEFGRSDGGAECDALAVVNSTNGPAVLRLCKRGCTSDTDCKAGYHCTADAFGSKVCEPDCDNMGAAAECGASACLTSWGCLSGRTCGGTDGGNAHGCQ
jgi:hypothetical protein